MNVEEIKEMYPEGTQIVLEEMSGESQMPCGLKGTVKFVDDIGQIHMKWDNGSSLALNVDEDVFSKVESIKVLLVEPNKYPKEIKIEDSLEAMQELVDGHIEDICPLMMRLQSSVMRRESQGDSRLTEQFIPKTKRW